MNPLLRRFATILAITGLLGSLIAVSAPAALATAPNQINFTLEGC